MVSIRYPKRLVRALLLFSAALLIHSLWHRIVGIASWGKRHAASQTQILDFAWGSSLHRFNNHALPLDSGATEFPWISDSKSLEARGLKEAVVWIVSSEVEGLHKTGGIGTAYVELAKFLAGSAETAFQINILVAHEKSKFTWHQLDSTTKR
jgi:hypothetical protein